MRIRSALLSACLPLAVSAATFVTAAGIPIVQPRSYTVQVDLHPEAGEIRARASVLLLRSDLTMSSIDGLTIPEDYPNAGTPSIDRSRRTRATSGNHPPVKDA